MPPSPPLVWLRASRASLDLLRGRGRVRVRVGVRVRVRVRVGVRVRVRGSVLEGREVLGRAAQRPCPVLHLLREAEVCGGGRVRVRVRGRVRAKTCGQ